MNHARRLDWRQWLAATRHPARKDGAIAVALLVLPWVIALVLWLLWLRRHHLDAGTAAAVIFGFAAVSVGLPVVWLAWVPIRNASRSSVPSGGDRAPGPTVPAGTPAGRQLAEVTDPFALEVHRPVQPEDPPPGLPELPVYVPREHDSALGSVVQAAAAGRSGIAVLVGGSSTGKTRACWEALGLLRDRPGPWRLWHPIDPTRPDAALRELSGIGPRTVVWLNEAQFYLDVPDGGPGERVAAGLRELLRDPDRAPVLVLATLWPRFWDTLTARPADGPDRHAQARELLAGHAITVPAAFTPAQMGQLARAPDARLALAAAGAQDGQVIQFLAGAPELLARYQNAPPAAAALITAAMDARRLGMGVGLPMAFLEAAAPGYLTDAEWDALGEHWENVLHEAWDHTAVPCKGVRGPLTRIRPRPGQPGSPEGEEQLGRQTDIGGGPLYRLADYLDQHGRRAREDRLGPPSLWDALATYAASASDLTRLGEAARDRGLYRLAAICWTRATALGGTDAAHQLITLLRQVSSSDTTCAAHWASSQVSLDDLEAVTKLLRTLREAGASDAVRTLLARNPASQVSLDHEPWACADLLEELREAGADDAATALAARAASEVSVHDPEVVALTLTLLRATGASDVVTALASRAASHASLGDPSADVEPLRTLRTAGAGAAATALAIWHHGYGGLGVDARSWGAARLLEELREAGASDAVTILAARAASHASLDNPWAIAELLEELREAGTSEAVTVLAARAASQTSLNHPSAIAELLEELREAGASDAVRALLAREPAAHVTLGYPAAIAELLSALREAGADDAVTVLAARAASGTSLDDPWAIAVLLEELREAGASDAVTVLAARAASGTSLDDPWAIAVLLEELREAGAGNAVRTLLDRCPTAQVSCDGLRFIAELLRTLREAGASHRVIATDCAGHASLDDPWALASLLWTLREAGVGDAVTTLASWAANHANLDDPRGVDWLLNKLREVGACEAVIVLAARAASQTSLDDPWHVAEILRALREGKASDAIGTLLARNPAAQVGFDNLLNVSRAVVRLLEELHEAGAGDAVTVLASRAASQISLNHPSAIPGLLEGLREAGASEAAHTLATRAAYASFGHPVMREWTVPGLLQALRHAGADDALTELAIRAADAGMFDFFLEAHPDEAPNYLFGREPNGAPSQPWRWQSPSGLEQQRNGQWR